MEGNLRFKIDWVSLIVRSKFTIFALFYFVFEGNFPRTSPRGAYIWRGDLTEGFLRYWFGGLIHGGADFRSFTVCSERPAAHTQEKLTQVTTGPRRRNALKKQSIVIFEKFEILKEEWLFWNCFYLRSTDFI